MPGWPKCNFPISDDLQALYGDNDWRLTHFFYKRRAVYTAQKSETSGTTGIYGYAFRTAEAYLNRAEAYAGKGDKDKALQDLKTIREKRLKVYEEVQAVTKEDVIRRVREEKTAGTQLRISSLVRPEALGPAPDRAYLYTRYQATRCR